MSGGKQLLAIARVADMLDVSTKTIRRMVREKRFPKPVRMIQGRPRWYQADVQTYLEALRLGILIDGRDEAEGFTDEVADEVAEKPVKGKN